MFFLEACAVLLVGGLKLAALALAVTWVAQY
jgi:hypothetical protein